MLSVDCSMDMSRGKSISAIREDVDSLASASLKTCVRVISSAFWADVPSDKLLDHITDFQSTTAAPALRLPSTTKLLPSVNQVAAPGHG